MAKRMGNALASKQVRPICAVVSLLFEKKNSLKSHQKALTKKKEQKSKKLVKSLPGGMHLIAVHLWASHENF
jgi:tRNA U38,U39,U40 pseudouridine synthase TruA